MNCFACGKKYEKYHENPQGWDYRIFEINGYKFYARIQIVPECPTHNIQASNDGQGDFVKAQFCPNCNKKMMGMLVKNFGKE